MHLTAVRPPFNTKKTTKKTPPTLSSNSTEPRMPVIAAARSVNLFGIPGGSC